MATQWIQHSAAMPAAVEPIDVAVELAGTITAAEAERVNWDLVIIGAGIAGSTTAILAAREGLQVLLVEAKRFPREKVCGGCLNPRAINYLQRLGVAEELRRRGVMDLVRLHVQFGRSPHCWPIPSLWSVRRSTVDTILVQAAIRSGVHFLPETLGTLHLPSGDLPSGDLPSCELRTSDLSSIGSATSKSIPAGGVKSNMSQEYVELHVRPAIGGLRSTSKRLVAKIAVVASGLNRSPLGGTPPWRSHVASQSRIGVQCMVHESELSPDSLLTHGPMFRDQKSLHMLVAPHGYVGLCKTDGGYYDIAAAVDPTAVQGKSSIPAAIDSIVGYCGYRPEPVWHTKPWLTTPHLTRCSDPVAVPRVFLVGDSIGYIEPFTGEGMSWALASAFAVVPLIASAIRCNSYEDSSSQWDRWAIQQRRFSQSVCRWIANQARMPRRAQWVLRVCDWFPPVRNWIVRKATQ
ncbi:MAG: FAD-dependent oxidoreductase [Planctomycetes bacterium]|nr:FAD-dependent oxidoreductase [Planctomycetota bacterium]